MDSDLRPKYQAMDSLKYDAVVCPNCGYAALNRFFNYMTDAQAKLIKANMVKKDAIVIDNFLAKIDYEKCDGCGLCKEKCPKKAIV